MKKLVYFTVIAAALLAASSCQEKPIDQPEVLPAPANAANAKKLVLSDNALNIKSIEFTEAGRYLIAFLEVAPVSSAPTKAAGDMLSYLTGSYTVSGNTYKLQGFGSVTIDGNGVTVNPDNGTQINTTFSDATQNPGSDIYTTVARTWKVDNSRITVNADGKNVTVTKPGCDLPSVAAELVQKGVKINPDRVAGYTVKDVIFTKSKTFAVEFTGQNPFVGEFDLKADNTFSYDFEGNSGNDFFNASSNGSVNYVAEDNQLVFSVNAVLKNSDGSKTYSGTVTMYMSEVK